MDSLGAVFKERRLMPKVQAVTYMKLYILGGKDVKKGYISRKL